MDTSSAIAIQGLSKNYGGFQLRDISFTVPRGAIVGFVGENGAGKTTTIKAILQLIRRDAGEITILGEAGPLSSAVKQKIGVVFDENAFHDTLKLHQVAKVLRRIYSGWNQAYFERLCSEFQLPEKQLIKEFSKGMKMKLNIAAALAHEPELLIMDEPTSGLDPVVREQILDLFMDFIQDERRAILFSSHITSDLDKVADYITFIHQGQLIFTEEKDAVLERYALLRCGAADFQALPEAAVVRYRQSAVGYEVLLDKSRLGRALSAQTVQEKITIEEIMLFYARGAAGRVD